SRPTADWVALGDRVNTPIVSVNTPKTLADDAQFQDRMAFMPQDVLGCEQIPSPIKFIHGKLPVPTHAPTVGEHTDEVLRELLGYGDDRIDALRASGALG